jgi:hypothetical protein
MLSSAPSVPPGSQSTPLILDLLISDLLILDLAMSDLEI